MIDDEDFEDEFYEDFDDDVEDNSQSLDVKGLAQNPMVKIGAVLLVSGALTLGYMMMPEDSADDSKIVLRVGAKKKVEYVPGQEKLDPVFKKALEESNKKEAEKAIRTGGSALPSPVGLDKEASDADAIKIKNDKNKNALDDWRVSSKKRRSGVRSMRDGDYGAGDSADCVPDLDQCMDLLKKSGMLADLCKEHLEEMGLLDEMCTKHLSEKGLLTDMKLKQCKKLLEDSDLIGADGRLADNAFLDANENMTDASDILGDGGLSAEELARLAELERQRELARLAELAKQGGGLSAEELAELERLRRLAAEGKLSAEELARLAELARKAGGLSEEELARLAELARQAELARLAELARQRALTEAELARQAELERLAREAEAARLAELARQAELARLAELAMQGDGLTAEELAELERLRRLAAEGKLSAEELARLAELARKSGALSEEELARLAELERQAEAARLAELARLAEEARLAELARQAELARLAEEARLAELARQAELARLAALGQNGLGGTAGLAGAAGLGGMAGLGQDGMYGAGADGMVSFVDPNKAGAGSAAGASVAGGASPEEVQALADQMMAILQTRVPEAMKSLVLTPKESPYQQMLAEEAQMAALEQSGGGAAIAGEAAEGEGGGEDPSAQVIAVPGDIFYAQILTEVNSDIPGTVLAQILNGPFAGGKAIGSFSLQQEHLILNFSTIVKDDVSYPIEAVALDKDTSLPGMATDVDHHYITRVLLPFAAKFIEGYSAAIVETGTTTETDDSGTDTTESPDPDPKESLYGGFEEATSVIVDEIDARATPPVTVKIRRGTTFGMLLTAKVTVGNAM